METLTVKVHYSKSLESYKNELKKEFESHKYIEDLCHSINKGLLRLLLTCKNESNNLTFDEPDKVRIDALPKLATYLKNYDFRYSHIDEVPRILAVCCEIDEFENDTCTDSSGNIFNIPHDGDIWDKYTVLNPLIDSLLAKFLPKMEL